MDKKRFYALFVVVMFILLGFASVRAQDKTVGLIRYDKNKAFNGYTLFNPLGTRTTYLIDMEGRVVHSWESHYRSGQPVYLLENGNLLRPARVDNPIFRAGGAGGCVQEFTWDGKLVWEFEYSSDEYLLHHDIEKLPNGNILMIAWEYKTAKEAIIAGRDPKLLNGDCLWLDCIIEVEPTGPKSGKIVWEWHIWDHLIQDYDLTKANYGVVANHPEFVNINFVISHRPEMRVNPMPDRGPGSLPGLRGADWTHFNAIDYNPTFDQILITSHGTSEIYVIDHSTTTKEAAGHTGGHYGKGGDILYRWGNPQVYRAGKPGDQKLFGPHDAHWIEPNLPGAGHILIFNNGQGRPNGDYSSIEEIVPPVDKNGNYQLAPSSAYGPAKPVWMYTAKIKTDFFSPNISSAQRLPNRDTLICSGSKGRFFEVSPKGEIVWEYINPVVGKSPRSQGAARPINKISQQPTRIQAGMPGLRSPSLKQEGIDNPVFRCYRYAPDNPGIAGKNLTPGNPIKLNSKAWE